MFGKFNLKDIEISSYNLLKFVSIPSFLQEISGG